MDCADLQHSCSIALIDYVTNLQIIKLLQRLKSIKIFYTAHPYNQTRESEIQQLKKPQVFITKCPLVRKYEREMHRRKDSCI